MEELFVQGIYNELLNNSHEVRYQAILDLLDKFWEKKIKEIGRVYQKLWK